MARKIIVAAGTAHYKYLSKDLQRPVLTEVVKSVAELFVKLGYERELQNISEDPTRSALVDELDAWFASSNPKPSDWVVFYYTGHGELEGEELVLLTHDSEDGRVPTTGVSARTLGQILTSRGKMGEKRSIPNCLLIFDTCHAGAGVFDLFSKLQNGFYVGDFRGRNVYVLAAAFPREEATAGALARALIECINDESLGGNYQRLIYPDMLWPAINRRLSPHEAMHANLGSSKEDAEFFPNPRYVPQFSIGATVADVRSAIEHGDVLTFWELSSQGKEIELQPGSYFAGRERVMRELSHWFIDANDDRTRVITGAPGSGKSAIIAMIVSLSDSKYRSQLSAPGSRWKEFFSPECITLAIHAMGKTYQDVMDMLAFSLKTEPDESKILAALRARSEPFRMVVDALDEAHEPGRIATDLLTKLQTISGIKLLVGTRSEHLAELGNGTVRLHIDRPEYFEQDDLVEYLTVRLLRSGRDGTKTPYQGQEILAREVAVVVSKRAYPNFLIARLVAEDLLASSEPLDQAAIRGREFPATVSKAFEQYLARFGADEMQVRDLLTPLAWAEGSGLPWGNMWATCASTLSARSYNNEDIRWLMNRAGSFVVETLEQGCSVYRLYHKALADYLRSGHEKEETQRLLVEALMETVPQLNGASSRKDWLSAHPYIRTHLSEHAAAAGILPDLIGDPAFLLTADPIRLVSALDAISAENPPSVRASKSSISGATLNVVHSYKQIFHILRNVPLEDRASYLEFSAKKHHDLALADKIASMPLNRKWVPKWARWSYIATHRVITGHSDDVNSVTFGHLDGYDLIVSGSRDGTIRLWNPSNGEAINVLDSKSGWVNSVALGRQVIVSGSKDGIVRVWEPASAKVICELNGDIGEILSVAIGRLDDKDVIVARNYSNVISVWDVATCESLEVFEYVLHLSCGELTFGSPNGLDISLTFGRHWKQDIVLAGGTLNEPKIWGLSPQLDPLDDNIVAGELTSERRTTERNNENIGGFLWDALGSQLYNFSYRGAIPHCMAIGNLYMQKVGVVGYRSDVCVVWDLASHKAMYSLKGHDHSVISVAVGRLEGKEVIISGSRDTTVRVWEPSPHETSPDDSIDPFQRKSITKYPYKSSRLLDHFKGMIAGIRWGGSNLQASGKNQAWAGSVAMNRVSSRDVVVAGIEKGTVLLEISTGRLIKTFRTQGRVSSVASGKLCGREVVVGANYRLQIWDASTGEPLRLLQEQDSGSPPISLGKEIIAASGDGENFRVWDISTGNILWDCEAGGSVTSIAIGKVGGREVIVAGTAEGRATVWEVSSKKGLSTFQNPRDQVQVRTGRGGPWVACVAISQIHKRDVVVSGDTELCLWDAFTGQLLRKADSHTGDVNSVAFTKLCGQDVIVSSSDDQTIRFWDCNLTKCLATIEIGASVNSISVRGNCVGAATPLGVAVLEIRKL